MEPRQHEQKTDRKLMEEVPQEPIAADPDESEAQNDADDGDDDEDEEDEIGQPVELEDERQ